VSTIGNKSDNAGVKADYRSLVGAFGGRSR
jgi:hypothetical protein